MNYPKRIEGYSFECANRQLSRAVMTEPDSRCGVRVFVITAREVENLEARVKAAEAEAARLKSLLNAAECRLIYTPREPGKLLHEAISPWTQMLDWSGAGDDVRERFAEIEEALFKELTAAEKAGITSASSAAPRENFSEGSAAA